MRAAVLAALLLACTTSSSGIHGRLLVHTGDPTAFTSVHVLLGHGTVYDIAVDGNGDALFEDRVLVGPQDVTVVWVEPASQKTVRVRTGLAIDREEVWIQEMPPPPPQLGTLNGRASGASTSNVWLEAIGPTVSGSIMATPDLTYSLPLRGDAQGTFDLVGVEIDGQGSALRAGLVRGLASAPTVTADVTLDRTPDQLVTIDVRGADPYSSKFTYDVEHYLDRQSLFFTATSGTPPPASVPTFAATGAFDGLARSAAALAGDFSAPNGAGYASEPMTSTSITVDLPEPLVSHSPPLENGTATTPYSLAGLDFAWTAGPGLEFSEVFFSSQDSSSGEQLFWLVIAPTASAHFAPFTLPADASPLSVEPGVSVVQIDSDFDERYTSYDYLSGAAVIGDEQRRSRGTAVIGSLLLQ